MATPSTTITSLDGRRCTLVRRSTVMFSSTSTDDAPISTSPSTESAPQSPTTIPSSATTAQSQTSSSTEFLSSVADSTTSTLLSTVVPSSSPAISPMPSSTSTYTPSLNTPSQLPSPSSDSGVVTPTTSPVGSTSITQTAPTSSSTNTTPSNSISSSFPLETHSDSATAPILLSSSTSSLPPISSSSPSETPTVPLTADVDSSRLSPGAIAAIIIGVLLAIALTATLLYVWVGRKTKGRKVRDWVPFDEKHQAHDEPSGAASGPSSRARLVGLSALLGSVSSRLRTVRSSTKDRPTNYAFSRARRSFGAGWSSLSDSDGSSRHSRSANAPPANRVRNFDYRFQNRLGRDRHASGDTIQSFFSGSPEDRAAYLDRNSGSNDLFPDSVAGGRTLHVVNPSVFSKSSTHLPQTPESSAQGPANQPRALLPLGATSWAQHHDLHFPLSRSPDDPFLDPPPAAMANRASRGPHATTIDASTDFLQPYRTRTRSATSTIHHASSYYAPSTIGSDSIYNAPPLPPLNAPVYPGMIRRVQDPFTNPSPQRPPPARSSSGSQDTSIYILPRNSSWDSAASLHRKSIPLPGTSSRASPATVTRRPPSRSRSSGSGSISGNGSIPSITGSGRSSGSQSSEVDPNLLMPHPQAPHLSSTTISSSMSSYLAYLDSSRPVTMASQQSDPFHLDRPEYYWRDSGSDVPDVPPLNIQRGWDHVGGAEEDRGDVR